jgi:hypothetical protein
VHAPVPAALVTRAAVVTGSCVRSAQLIHFFRAIQPAVAGSAAIE